MRTFRLPPIALYAPCLLILFFVGLPQALAQTSFTNTAQFSNFTLSFPSGWSALPANRPTMLLNLPAGQATRLSAAQLIVTPQIHVSTEQRTSAEEASARLMEIAAETSEPVTSLTIRGWPAIQRRHVAPWTRLGNSAASGGSMALTITTVIAAGNQIIRIEGSLPADSPAYMADEMASIEQSVGLTAGGARSSASALGLVAGRTDQPQTGSTLEIGQVETVRAQPKDDPIEDDDPPLLSSGSATAGTPSAPGASSRLLNGGAASEPEVSVSSDGRNVVVAQQLVWTYSNDGGLTFTFGGPFPNSTGGDSSLAFGLSGNFYEGTIFNNTTAIHRSTDNGATFQVRGTAFTCTTAAQCGFTPSIPDQEHIAADRTNAASGGGDQVYSAFRNGFNPAQWGIVCSTDGGATWSAGNVGIAGDFPRIAVGQDGSVYVAYVSGSNLMLDKFASCNTNSALPALAGFPKTVATGINELPCPVAGLDRCNNGNTLRSPMMAIDDTNASHIYYSYATSTGAGNENVIARDSTDGGATWTRPPVTINGGGTARRFMPWVCATKGTAYVSWYDRRNATAADNDLTDYFGASAALSAGNLTAGAEFQINDASTSDAQCEAGQAVGSGSSWPGGSRAAADSGSCSRQPQLGGQCQHSPPDSTDSATPCNLNPVAACAVSGETCQTASGTPKYGDYNGNACAQGHFYTVWASATPPRATSPGIDLFFKVRDTVVPIAACKAVTTQTDPGVCMASGVSIDNGSTDPDHDTFTLSQSPPGPYSKGTTSVKLTITDQNAQTNSCTANITVNDLEKPTITCLAPKLECTSPAGAVVANLINHVSDNCAILSKGCSPAEGSTFPLGVDPFTCTATDTSSNTNSCASNVTVTDTTPPVIKSVSAKPNTLWPPNHKLTPIAITVTATDICDTSPKCQVVSVTANEPVLGPGSGNTDPDWIIDNPGPKVSPATLGVQVRNERSGTGTGRVYTIGVSCSDASGNTTPAQTTVTVAHDQGT